MMNSEIRPGARWWTAGTLVVIGALSVVGCAEEIRSDPADGAEEARPTVSVSTPVVDASPGFETNLYSEHDADVYSRLMIEETAAGGIPITAIHVEVGEGRTIAGQPRQLRCPPVRQGGRAQSGPGRGDAPQSRGATQDWRGVSFGVR
jgi:hypothetical protein